MSDLVTLRSEIEACPECTMDGLDLCPEHSDELPESNSIVEDIVYAVHSTDRRVSLTKELADDLDITAQTVRNHLQDVLADPTIDSREVRGAKVIYPSEESTQSSENPGYVPAEAYRRALERQESLSDYLRDLVSVESALKEAGYEKVSEK
ncbi:hypothetical protein [Halobacterium sp. CBA1126]|uniref:hypothetical protein n=1 Tax=Halobacterium sp. CBA1126 TaxID=2668074 RepID=UPI0012FCD733|nr:hypothetical protein [Halobacterium sp. CBA1126]MUV59767.1 hypothetical protein [Halobacterium sp. CBA1126]